MDPLDFGRWQFGITTVYHFFMVPLTLGLGLVVTYLYIRYVRTKKDEYKRMTKFWGKLYLINFAMGVATGLVQEFQFGVNTPASSATSSALRWQWKASSPSSLSRPSWVCGSSVGTASSLLYTHSRCSWQSSAPGFLHSSFWLQTPGCSTPSVQK